MTAHRPKTLAELEHFPFKTFAELKKAAREGVATISVHSSAPLQWVRVEGPCSGTRAKLSPLQKTSLFVLSYLPFIACIGLLAYMAVNGSWWLLLTLPLLFIAFALFYHDPARHTYYDAEAIQRARTMGFMRRCFIVSTFVGLGWGLLGNISWLTAATLTIAVICLAQRTANHKSIDWLANTVWKDEELLCALWDAGALKVRLSNGNSYLADCSLEGNQYSYFKRTFSDPVFQQAKPLQTALLASITEQELESGNIADARLAEIKLNSDLWAIILRA